MSTLAHSSSHVLADRLQAGRSLVGNTVLVLGGAVLVGLLAQVSIPMWPVPITGQTLGVMLVGATLGSRRGAASLASYAALGVAGIPWFAQAQGGPQTLLSPTFGFILGFIAAAWVAGRLAEQQWDRRTWTSLGAFGIATIIPFLTGVPWMWAVLHFVAGKSLSLVETLWVGVIPFIPGGAIKALIASCLLLGVWRISGAPRDGQ